MINVQQSAGGVLLPKSAVKFERYLVGEVLFTDPSQSYDEVYDNSLLALITSEGLYVFLSRTDSTSCICVLVNCVTIET